MVKEKIHINYHFSIVDEVMKQDCIILEKESAK